VYMTREIVSENIFIAKILVLNEYRACFYALPDRRRPSLFGPASPSNATEKSAARRQ
jgi:hypothetical protein